MYSHTSADPRECPEYFVSTRALMLVGDSMSETEWRPWGEQHALILGATTTACGERAHTLRFFPDLPFPEAAAPVCRRCMMAVARVREEILL